MEKNIISYGREYSHLQSAAKWNKYTGVMVGLFEDLAFEAASAQLPTHKGGEFLPYSLLLSLTLPIFQDHRSKSSKRIPKKTFFPLNA